MSKRILMIGCGAYARDNHLPILSARSADVSIAAILTGRSELGNVEARLQELQLETEVHVAPEVKGTSVVSGAAVDIDKIEAAINETVERSVRESVGLVDNLIETHRPQGAIVSTVSALNFPIAELCLRKGLHVLVEKPATSSWGSGVMFAIHGFA